MYFVCFLYKFIFVCIVDNDVLVSNVAELLMEVACLHKYISIHYYIRYQTCYLLST